MSKWQPIETAPKDGQDIILGWTDSTVYPGFWMDNPDRNHWGESGWFCIDDDVYTSHPSRPTHWQPFPSPPTL